MVILYIIMAICISYVLIVNLNNNVRDGFRIKKPKIKIKKPKINAPNGLSNVQKEANRTAAVAKENARKAKESAIKLAENLRIDEALYALLKSVTKVSGSFISMSNAIASA